MPKKKLRAKMPEAAQEASLPPLEELLAERAKVRAQFEAEILHYTPCTLHTSPLYKKLHELDTKIAALRSKEK